MQPSLQYQNQGRGGTVVYTDAISSIPFSFEFGGGDCVAIIFIPSPGEWVKNTGRTLDDRETVIRFVAQQCLHDQVSNGYYSISEHFIELHRRQF